MTNEIKNVPELRFPEFKEVWEEKKLEDLLKFNNGINASKEQYGIGTKFINVLDILNTNFITYEKIIGRVNVSKAIENRNKVEYGDILFLRSSETREDVGMCNVYLDKEKHSLYGGFIIRGKRIGEYSPFFLKILLNNSKARKSISSLAGGSTRFNVSQDILKVVEILVPKISEQKKIGDFFSKLDHQIELEEQKLEKLEEQKKGYMQQILSQTHRFRDKSEENYPDWKEEKLGNLITEINEKTTSSNQYLLLSSTKNGLVTQSDYFKKQIGSKDNTGYKILNLNQMVISPQNLWLGNINFNEQFEIGIVSPSYRVYEFNPQFSFTFAKNLLKTSRYIYEYAQASEQGASVVRRNLNLDLFYEIKISLPILAEQRVIGEFFNKIDISIEKQSNKVKLLKERKKGFLQKMFV